MTESCPPWPGLQMSLCKSNVLPWQAAHPFSFVRNRNGFRDRGDPEIGTSHLIIKKSQQPAESMYVLFAYMFLKKGKKLLLFCVWFTLSKDPHPKDLKRDSILCACSLLKVILYYLREKSAGVFFCKKVFNFILQAAAPTITKLTTTR